MRPAHRTRAAARAPPRRGAPPRGAGIRRAGRAALRRRSRYAQLVAQAAAAARHEVEQLRFGARLRDGRDHLAGGRVLHAQVEPQPFARLLALAPVRAQTTRSVPRLARTRASVSGARLSASVSDSSTFMRATFSPGMVRSRSPAASSVLSISDSAVESHALSARPDRFLKPSTATERRGRRAAPRRGASGRGRRAGVAAGRELAHSATATASGRQRPRRRSRRRRALAARARQPAPAQRGTTSLGRRKRSAAVALRGSAGSSAPTARVQVGPMHARRGRRLPSAA